jgi:cardiolipin synthase
MRGALTVPNLLTASRLVLAPLFLTLYVRGDTVRALAAFSAAAATDLLDGLLARVLDQRSRLGAVLDPIADKFLAACALFALAERGRLPMWLPVLVVSRDVAQLAAAGVLRAVHRTVPIAPTRIGKYATFFIAATVVTALAGEFATWGDDVLAPTVAALGLLAAECVVVSFVQYFLFFLRTARAPAPAAGQPGT